jgi:hypothetical protein
MEKNNMNKETIEKKYNSDSDDDIDYNELTSHKIEKNTSINKNAQKLIVILEHA